MPCQPARGIRAESSITFGKRAARSGSRRDDTTRDSSARFAWPLPNGGPGARLQTEPERPGQARDDARGFACSSALSGARVAGPGRDVPRWALVRFADKAYPGAKERDEATRQRGTQSPRPYRRSRILASGITCRSRSRFVRQKRKPAQETRHFRESSFQTGRRARLGDSLAATLEMQSSRPPRRAATADVSLVPTPRSSSAAHQI
jgi:hypothetical protein